MFHPHTFSPKFHGTPHILLSEQAYRDMATIVDNVDIEVGWLGTSYMEVTPKGAVLRIEEVFIMEQDCHAATTELTPNGIATTVTEIMEADMANGITDVADPKFRANHIRFWGH